jgi:hypothetical protein
MDDIKDGERKQGAVMRKNKRLIVQKAMRFFGN